MAYIENETSRKATFRKRKGGIMKKAMELSILCDVPMAVIIESEYNSVPEVFPREGVERVMAQWDMLSKVDKNKKMLNQDTYLKQRVDKATERFNKVEKENRELAMKEVMFDCLRDKTAACSLGKDELRDLGGVVDQYIKVLNRRIQVLAKNDASSSSSVVPALAGGGGGATFFAMPRFEMGSSSTGFNDMTYSTGFNHMIQENMNVIPNVKDFDLNQAQ